MARLAARTDQPVMVETAVVAAPADDPRTRLGRLGAAIPELTPDVLCMAFLMAQRGAEAALLVRTFRLTW